MKNTIYTIKGRVNPFVGGGLSGQAFIDRLANNGLTVSEPVTFSHQKLGNLDIILVDGEAIAAIDTLSKNGIAVKADEFLQEAATAGEVVFTKVTPEDKSFELTVTFSQKEAPTSTPNGKALTDCMEKIVKEGLGGVTSMDELNERVTCMKENARMPEASILRVLETYKKTAVPVRKPKTVFVDPIEGDNSTLLYRSIKKAICNIATIFEGDKSVGKNVAAETVAWLLGLPTYIITFNRQMTPEDIYGTKKTNVPEISTCDQERLKSLAFSYVVTRDASNRSSYSEKDWEKLEEESAEFQIIVSKSQTVQIEQEKAQLYCWLVDGGVMIFNEMANADPNFFESFTNPLCDGTGGVDIPGFGFVRRSEHSVLIGNRNVGYAGEMEQNEATESRFAILQFPYPKSILPILQSAVSEKAKKLPKRIFTTYNEIYMDILASFENAKTVSDKALMVRGFVEALNEYAEFPDANSAAENLIDRVMNHCESAERQTLINAVNRKFGTMFK